MNCRALRNLPLELWTRIFRFYVDVNELQNWRRVLHSYTHRRYSVLPVDGPVLRKPARVLVAVCSSWRSLIAVDDQMKVICGDISQIGKYVSKDAASQSMSRDSRFGPRLWAYVPDTSSPSLLLLAELAPRLEAIWLSDYRKNPGPNMTNVFQTLAHSQFDRLSYVSLTDRDDPDPVSALPDLPPNAPNLTTLVLYNVQIVEGALDWSRFSILVGALPRLERLELFHFAEGIQSDQEFAHVVDQDDGYTIKLNALKIAILMEQTACIIFLLGNADLPKLENLEIRGGTFSGSFSAPVSWIRQRDFTKLSKLDLSPLDFNTARFLTSSRFPLLSRLVINTRDIPSQDNADVPSTWPAESSSAFAPNLEQLSMQAHPTVGGEWLLNQLTREDCDRPIKSMLLYVNANSSWKGTMLPVAHWLNVPPSTFANVQALTIRVESGVVHKIDGNSLDHICAAFQNVVELHIYLELRTSGSRLSRFQFLTPDCPGDPEFRTMGQQVILPRLEILSLSLRISLTGSFGPTNHTIGTKNCLELTSFLQKRNSSGHPLKRLVFNHPIVAKTRSSLQRLVDDIIIDPNPWKSIEAMQR